MKGSIIASLALVAFCLPPPVSAQRPGEAVTTYIQGQLDGVFVAGAVRHRRAVDLYIHNYSRSTVSFDPESDRLHIRDGERMVPLSHYAFDYYTYEVAPGRLMKVRFVLPENIEISPRQVYFLTLNSSADTLAVVPTDHEIVQFLISRTEGRAFRRELYDMARVGAFIAAATLLFSVL